MLRRVMISEYEIKLINKIIFEAIKHGGDSGGPYFTNEDGLISAINKLLDIERVANEYEIQELTIEEGNNIWSGIHQIVKKGKRHGRNAKSNVQR